MDDEMDAAHALLMLSQPPAPAPVTPHHPIGYVPGIPQPLGQFNPPNQGPINLNEQFEEDGPPKKKVKRGGKRTKRKPKRKSRTRRVLGN